MASQLMLFETEQERTADGSFVVRPRRLEVRQEIGVAKAAGMLGFRDRETIYRLIDLGEIDAWKPTSRRGNGKYRIDLASVIAYRTRQQVGAARAGR